jgi:selenocysteine lyase/cysteine desulfurase
MTTQLETIFKTETDYSKAITKLEEVIFRALQTYSNVERGSGQFSQITTALVEESRKVVLQHMQLSNDDYIVIFCTPRWAGELKAQLMPKTYFMLSSCDMGLPIGLVALVVKKTSLPKGIPSQTGGGMIKLVSANSLVLADIPERFEAGTPAIINIIAFAKALQIINQFGFNPFQFADNHEEIKPVDDILFIDNIIDIEGHNLLKALQQSVIGKNIKVPVLNGQRTYTNLDNAASTPTFAPIWETVCKTLCQPRQIQQQIISSVKDICSGFLGAPLSEYDIIFCSNTTEAINIAVQNFDCKQHTDIEPVVLNTTLEHHSNELPWRFSKKAKLIRLPVNNDGIFDLKQIQQILIDYNQKKLHGKQRITLLAISGASNVLGTYNDIKTAAKLAHQYNAQILVDSAQLVAHRKVSLTDEDIDFFAFSGHKMYAPFGSGALISRRKFLNFQPAELAKIKASGEENIIGIAAMGKAMNLLQRVGMDIIQNEESQITHYTIERLSKIEGLTIFGLQDFDSPEFVQKGGIVSFKLKNVPHNLVAIELAEIGGIGVRTGCFCAHLITKQLMGITSFRGKVAEISLKLFPSTNTAALPGIVRISLGIENDEHDIDHFIDTLQKITSSERSGYTKFLEYMQNGVLVLPITEAGKSIVYWVNRRIKNIL